jgi:hypothetical protein
LLAPCPAARRPPGNSGMEPPVSTRASSNHQFRPCKSFERVSPNLTKDRCASRCCSLRFIAPNSFQSAFPVRRQHRFTINWPLENCNSAFQFVSCHTFEALSGVHSWQIELLSSRWLINYIALGAVRVSSGRSKAWVTWLVPILAQISLPSRSFFPRGRQSFRETTPAEYSAYYRAPRFLSAPGAPRSPLERFARTRIFEASRNTRAHNNVKVTL